MEDECTYCKCLNIEYNKVKIQLIIYFVSYYLIILAETHRIPIAKCLYV